MRPSIIWIEQYDVAKKIEDNFGTDKALGYLIGEKFLNFLEVAETNAEFRGEILAFVVEIKTICERWQRTEHLETTRQTEPFDPRIYEDSKDIRGIGRRTPDDRPSISSLSSRRGSGY